MGYYRLFAQGMASLPEVPAPVRGSEGAMPNTVSVATGRLDHTKLAEDRSNVLGSYVLNAGGRRSIYDLNEEATIRTGYRASVLDAGTVKVASVAMGLLTH